VFREEGIDQANELSLSFLFLPLRQNGKDLIIHQSDLPEGFP
jgi:hypothetical protein